MLEPFVEAICFPQTLQFAASLSGETAFSYVTSYTAPQWWALKGLRHLSNMRWVGLSFYRCGRSPSQRRRRLGCAICLEMCDVSHTLE